MWGTTNGSAGPQDDETRTTKCVTTERMTTRKQNFQLKISAEFLRLEERSSRLLFKLVFTLVSFSHLLRESLDPRNKSEDDSGGVRG